MTEDIVKRVERLEDRVSEMDKNLSIFITSVKYMAEVSDKLSDSMEKLGDAFVEMNLMVQSMTFGLDENTKSVRGLEERLGNEIASIKQDVNKIDNKAKIDWMEIVKKSIVTMFGYIATASIATGIVFLIIKTVPNLIK